MKYDLTDNELLKVCELISANLGLHFPVERWAMLGRNLSLAAHEFGFQSTNGFIPWLLTSELNKNQINILASYLTVTETYFWREPQVFTALTDHILPELIRSKKKGDKSIRIWSAGCSTGEEAYSLAITLHKTIPKIKDWNISILATDINPKALEKARAGTYGPWSFRNTPDWIRTGYFHHHEDRKYEIIPEVKKIVTFSCHNLTGDDIFSDIENKMDIIFCRNVLMYFTPGWINRISKNLYHSLSEYGWLVVASSELSSQVFPQFTAVNFPGAVLYTKAKNRVEKSHFNISTPSIIQPLQPSSTLQPVHPITPSPHLPITPSPLLPVSQSTIIQPQKTYEESYNDKIFAIRLLANQGYLTEALSLCNEAIASEKLAPGFYFIRASILQEIDKIPEAIASLRQAIYIDPDYIMGHFTLGNLFIGQGNANNAKRYLNNVLDLLSKHSNGDVLPDSEGLSVKYIREIIYANMETISAK